MMDEEDRTNDCFVGVFVAIYFVLTVLFIAMAVHP